MKSALDLLGQVHALGLEVFHGFHGLSLKQHEQAWNGVGSAKFGDALLEISTAILVFWDEIALIHDDEWTYHNDGTRLGWEESNDRFWRNGKTKIRKTVPWWRIFKRQALSRVNDALLLALSTDYSFDGWVSTFEAMTEEGPERLSIETELRTPDGRITFLEGSGDSA